MSTPSPSALSASFDKGEIIQLSNSPPASRKSLFINTTHTVSIIHQENDEETSLLKNDYLNPRNSLNASIRRSPSWKETLSSKLLAPKPKKETLGFWTLVFLSYFCTCGGPYGLEVAISSGYPLFTIIGIFAVPWIWSLPLALMTAELSTSLRSNDGLVLWTKTAFGPMTGFVCGFVAWLNAVVDTALYPSLYMSYISQLFEGHPFIKDPAYFYTIQFSAVFLLLLLNLFGVDIVGNVSAVFALLVIAPFIVLFIWAGAAGEIQPKEWLAVPPHTTATSITMCLNILIWSYSGYDSVGSIAEELKNPKKNFPKAMVTTIFLSIFTYLLSIIGTLGIITDYSKWNEGFFVDLAKTLGGKYLGLAMMIAGTLSSLGSYNAILCASSQQLRAVGEKDLLNLPILTWRHPRFHTPWVAIFVNSILISICTFLPFDRLLQINNIFYSLILLIEYASLIRLRFTHKFMIRPYRISESNVTTILLCIPPICICCFVIVTAVMHSLLQLTVAIGVLVVPLSIYGFLYLRRRRAGHGAPDGTN